MVLEVKYMKCFDVYADFEIFKKVPAVDKEGLCVADAAHYGDENYVIVLTRVSFDTYREYLGLLESDGFVKYADNGENGINNDVYAANYTKGELVVTVSFMARTGEMYISAKEGLPLSAHLHKAECADLIQDGKTTLTMHQVPDYGNCYVIGLKNGHYIINDGGFPDNIDPLLEALEKEAGGKPVVEAWFVSHEHWDHIGVLDKLAENEELSKRIAVNGIYVSQVRETVQKRTAWYKEVGTCKRAAPMLKTATGETTPVYRVHAGERYYFCDISVEVLYTQEQLRLDRYVDNLNASCTWLMYHIQDQTFLLCGDTELINMRDAAAIYAPEFWNVDIMNNHHHGLNLYTDDLGYFKTKTLLYSTWGTYSIYWRPKITLDQNLELQRDHCLEYMSYMDGGKRLTFPYEIGTAENLTPWYPEMSEMCTARQYGWLQEAGLL